MTDPEFSRRLEVATLGSRGRELAISANPDERAALAARFGLLELSALSARVRLRPLAGGTLVRLEGDLLAELVQECVVTLEPVPARIADRFEMVFGPPEAEEREVVVAFDQEDPPEPIVDGAVDLGEAVVQALAERLDPFPRAPGAAHAGSADSEPPPEPGSHFAALARLRRQ